MSVSVSVGLCVCVSLCVCVCPEPFAETNRPISTKPSIFCLECT